MLKRNSFKRAEAQLPLGPLEFRAMEILWTRGESNVRAVAEAVGRPLAYTTVMTTLDRLFKKGLLKRRKSERAFWYAPLLSRQEWDRKVADEWVSRFLNRTEVSGDILISCLVDAVGVYDEALLDDLERKIKARRREIGEAGKP